MTTGEFQAGDNLLYSYYRKSEELGTLRQVARALASSTNTSDVLQTICDTATVQGRGSGASVSQISADSGVFVAVKGPVQELKGLKFPLEGSVTGRVAKELRTIAITGASESSPFFHELLPRLNIGPILVLPLLAQGDL